MAIILLVYSSLLIEARKVKLQIKRHGSPGSVQWWLVPRPGVFYRQKTQTTKFPDLAVVACTPFWSFCAGQRRIGPGQITDGT